MTNGNGTRHLDESEEAQQRIREERAARVRAARAHANRSQAEVAELFGVSVGTIKRMESGRRDISLEEMVTVADFCGVPSLFMLKGFDAIQSGLAQREAQALVEEVQDLVRAEFAMHFERLSQALITENQARTLARDAVAHLERAS